MKGERLIYIENKIMDHDTAVKCISNWKLKNDKVVFTNGCFDLLHKGHVSYLAQAASLGSRLVVALNTDRSVRRQGKGDDRPVNDENARALVMASLGVVDAVVFFDSDTPLSLIDLLKPDVLVKGADYDPKETNPQSKSFIVGSESVRVNGGEVAAIPIVEGYSTTSIINQLQKK